MKVTTQELGNREVELTIEVDDERVERAMRKIARKYAREVNIPGFRPGKAPFAVVARRVGQERLLEDALEEMASDIYQEAIEEAGIEPYELKPLEISNYDPLTLTATIPLMPAVDLGDYHSIEVEAPAVDVTEEEIEAVLHEYREENAQLVPVERPAELEDQVILDLEIQVDDDLVYDRANISFVLSPDGLTGVPVGFFEEIAGMEPGEDRTFSLMYAADFPDEDLAGKVGKFDVTLHEVKDRELPELDDEFAQTVGDFETLEALRERTREILLARAETEAESELSERVFQQLLAMSTVEYPDAAVEQEIDHMIEDFEARLQDRGWTLDNYQMMQGVTDVQLRDEYRADAEERLKRGAVLSEVVEREGIEVSNADIDSEIEMISQMYGTQAPEVRETLSSADSRRSLRSRLLAEKAIDRLVEIATGASEAEEVADETTEQESREDEDAGTVDVPTVEAPPVESATP